MRILHVTPYYTEAWAYGGIPRVVDALVHAQRKLGHKVSIWTTDTAGPGSRACRAAEVSDEIYLATNLSNRAAFRHQLFLPVDGWRTLKLWVEGADLVHIHGHRHGPELLAAYFAYVCRRPLVLQPNGTGTMAGGKRRLKRLVDGAGLSRVLRSAPRVVAVSEWEARELVCHGVARERISIVPNPLRLPALPPKAPSSKRSVVAYLGQFTTAKRLGDLVAAAGMLKTEKVEIVLAGGTDEELNALVQSSCSHSNVRAVGVLRGDERFEFLAAASLVVYATESEAFGLVPFEALSVGTPVVVGQNTGAAEWCGAFDGAAVVPTRSPAVLARTIDRVLTARESWKGRAMAQRSKVEAAFSPLRIAEQMNEVYATVSPGSR